MAARDQEHRPGPLTSGALSRRCHGNCAEPTPARAKKRGRRVQALLNAPREIRTPTVQTDHKALNLARLPVPPQARSRLSIDAGHSPLDAVRGAGYSANTCSDYVNGLN